MLSSYLNQVANHEKKVGQDAHGQATYETKSIPCRKVRKHKLVRDAYGEDVVSETTVLTEAEVVIGDRIDGRPVIAIADMVNRRGEILGYEVML